jgi:putative membrane protein
MKDRKGWHRRYLSRTAIVWVGEAAGLMLLAYLIPGLSVNSFETALAAVVAFGLLNAIFWPILSRLTFPFLVYTVGIGALLLNGLLIWLTSQFVEGIIVEGWAALILTPIGLAAISTFLSAALTIDDDASYYRRLQRNAKKIKQSVPNDKPGVIFLEIDGLAESVLREAIEKGRVPTLARWLAHGSHKIISWETDLSSQTGASQAGILHGNNKDLPAFRWVEKERSNKIMASTGMSDAPVIEARISNGKGLLAVNGASRSNLFSGDAEDNIFTYSRLKDIKRFYTKSWHYFYSTPSNFPRVVALFMWDIVKEFLGRVRQFAKNIKPRLRKGLFIYFLTRAAANVFLREITTDTLIGDLITGQVDVVYATYVAYDEIAHHNGIADDAAFDALNELDKQFHRLEGAQNYAPRPYRIVVLSDHGQTNGATFKQRCGFTLDSLVRTLIDEDVNVLSELDSNQDHFAQAFADPIQRRTQYVVDKIEPKSRRKRTSVEEAQIIVLASGNLGLIYFTKWKERMSYEQLNQAFPRLIPGLVNQKWVGFILVNSEAHGPLVLGARGKYYLRNDLVEGEDPLATFGPRAAAHLKRTDGFNNVPDILVNSYYDPERDEVAAFEELIGSHGGLGGGQSEPFVLYPSEWDLEKEEIIGAEALHGVLKSLLNDMWT